MKIFSIMLLAISLQAISKLPKLEVQLQLPETGVTQELNKDIQLFSKDRPLRIATTTKVADVYVLKNNSSGGQWDQLDDGSWVWRFKVHAENALSLDFGLSDFYLPPTATLSFYDYTGTIAKGPFTDKKNMPHKQLWPGPIIGDTAIVELKVSNKFKPYVSFSIRNISRGFRSIWQDVELLSKNGQQKFWSKPNNNSLTKSASCNVDVACDTADGWQDQVRSVARYTVTTNEGVVLCTGQMINNTANDGKPLFLTAEHCGFNDSNDATINIWWNYQSNQCRIPGSGASSSPISIAQFNDTQFGSTFRASDATSDFALLELDDLPSPLYQVFYTGWDRRDRASNSAVTIHHPDGHAKRISVENNSLTITENGSSLAGNRSHLRVENWDNGTTEQGSSGSGLWNSDKLLIGQLHGGFAACGNNEADWFGRLNTSWEGGGSSDSRLKDWLDPLNSSVQTLQGFGGCAEMNVSIQHNNNSPETGTLQNFSVAVSGGVAPYIYQWDINADGEIDGTNATISANYTQKFIDNVFVTISDSNGCTSIVNKAIVIESPEVTLLNALNPNQVCGNSDAFVDPGERWRIPVRMQNNGTRDARNAYAVITKNSTSNIDILEQDNFGNTTGSCTGQFIDISSTGTELPLLDRRPSDGYSAQDEGVAIANLSQSFNLYGQTINSLYLSSNGYISVDPTESGADWDNDCPLPALPNNSADGVSTKAKISPLHDDFITQHIFHQRFNTCPRQSELGADLACDVFMYNDVDLYDQNNNTVEHFNFEAILYPAVNQWVFQYDGTGFNPASSTIGLQNDNALDGVSYACNTPNSINTQQAVCIYHRDNQPNTNNTFFNLETPIIAMGNLQVSQQHNDFVEFSVPQNATCGSALNIQLQAAVYDSGFNHNNTEIFSTTLGNNGSCASVSGCSPIDENDIQAQNGFWHNPNRPGNGNDMYFSDTGLIYLQYTALEDRSPIWYITTNATMQNNQSYNELAKVSYNGPFLSSTQSMSTVGHSVTTLIDANNAVQTRTINGKFSADLIQALIFSNATTTQQRTGQWYNPNESGWGVSVGTQGETGVVISYLYDNIGQPYWLLGSGINNTVTNTNMSYYNTFCPHCPLVPTVSIDVGQIRIKYDESNLRATMQNMQININNSERNSQWNRSDMPLVLLTPPLDD